MNEQSQNWSTLSPEERKKALFLQQKQTLDIFLANHAIDQKQYNKSLGDLREKMEIRDE